MATIIKDFDPIVDREGHDQSDIFVRNYWRVGDLPISEKIYPIPFWKVHQMFSTGDDNKITLRVRNINNPNHVFAEWMPLEEGLVNALNDDSMFFVIDYSAFYGPISNPGGEPFGGINGVESDSPDKNIICGRIGKSPTTGQHHVFFMAAECKIITSPGAGGLSAACGAKVPPGGRG